MSFAENEGPCATRARPRETIRMYVGFLLLGLFCLTISISAGPVRLALSRERSTRLGRRLVASFTRTYLKLLVLMGACRFDLSELDTLRDAPAMVIAPNHPSLLDALLVLSALPDATCVMKADIVDSPVFGGAARLAGYVRNAPLRAMVHEAIANLHRGSHVLLFPEGTRTTQRPIGRLQGTTGLIAKHAGVPVQTVFIETDSGFLGKGWSWSSTPRLPVSYRVRLGQRFESPENPARFVHELETYFRSELAQ
jgi:1-acyl-sn-glycerol-3-phosphate acyltransferase